MNNTDCKEEIRSRLLEYAESMMLSERMFCKKCGLSASYLRTFKGVLSLKTKRLIEEAFPALNLNWVETGEGNMLKSGTPNVIFSNVKANNVAGRDVLVGDAQLSAMEQIAALRAELAVKTKLMEDQNKLIDRLMKLLESK